MHTFKDKTGKEWQVVIDVAAVKRVHQLLDGFNLYSLIEDGAKPLGEFLADPIRLIDVLYVLCKEQADTAGMSDESFGRGFGGDSLEGAGDAFLAEYIDFFPNRQARESLQKIVAKGKKLGSMMLDRAERKIAEINLENEVESLAAKLANGSGAAPDKSALIQAPLRSAN